MSDGPDVSDRPGEDEDWTPVEDDDARLRKAQGEPPWYVDGLRFACTGCGKCCRNHGDGYAYVYADKAERKALAEHFGLTLKAFDSRYTERVPGGRSFKSRKDACIFLDAKGQCSVYDFRPRQCRTWPFWPELLDDQDTWERDVASFCPGVGDGPLHDFATIRRIASEADS